MSERFTPVEYALSRGDLLEKPSERGRVSGRQPDRPLATTLSDLEVGMPEDTIRNIKDKLQITESVEALMVERETIIHQLEEALSYFSKEKEGTTPEKAAERANFGGDWSVLTRQRLEHPVGFVKYMFLKLKHIERLKPGSAANFLQKPSEFRGYVFDQIKKYEDVIDHVFGATEVTTSKVQNKLPSNLGVNAYGGRPVVFLDAARTDGTTLSEHQRHIVESHEAGHGVREFVGTEGDTLRSLLDMEQIPSKNRLYLSKPEEIAERMSQLKNYFGLRPTEDFNHAHLQYAREHYIMDTGLDNDMSYFFAGITPDREEAFIKLINELPI